MRNEGTRRALGRGWAIAEVLERVRVLVKTSCLHPCPMPLWGPRERPGAEPTLLRLPPLQPQDGDADVPVQNHL